MLRMFATLQPIDMGSSCTFTCAIKDIVQDHIHAGELLDVHHLSCHSGSDGAALNLYKYVERKV
jgi:hypothetical protein